MDLFDAKSAALITALQRQQVGYLPVRMVPKQPFLARQDVAKGGVLVFVVRGGASFRSIGSCCISGNKRYLLSVNLSPLSYL